MASSSLSEDLGPHAVFLFLGTMGWGDGISRMVVVVVALPPNPIWEIGLTPKWSLRPFVDAYIS